MVVKDISLEAENASRVLIFYVAVAAAFLLLCGLVLLLELSKAA